MIDMFSLERKINIPAVLCCFIIEEHVDITTAADSVWIPWLGG